MAGDFEKIAIFFVVMNFWQQPTLNVIYGKIGNYEQRWEIMSVVTNTIWNLPPFTFSPNVVFNQNQLEISTSE